MKRAEFMLAALFKAERLADVLTGRQAIGPAASVRCLSANNLAARSKLFLEPRPRRITQLIKISDKDCRRKSFDVQYGPRHYHGRGHQIADTCIRSGSAQSMAIGAIRGAKALSQKKSQAGGQSACARVLSPHRKQQNTMTDV